MSHPGPPAFRTLVPSEQSAIYYRSCGNRYCLYIATSPHHIEQPYGYNHYELALLSAFSSESHTLIYAWCQSINTLPRGTGLLWFYPLPLGQCNVRGGGGFKRSED